MVKNKKLAVVMQLLVEDKDVVVVLQEIVLVNEKATAEDMCTHAARILRMVRRK